MVQLGEKAVYPVGHRNLRPAMTDGGGTLPIRAVVTVSYPCSSTGQAELGGAVSWEPMPSRPREAS
jgi:hypothetical protein